MRAVLVLALALLGLAVAAPAPAAAPLRICADPNNLPFSNARGEGFENRLAELLAAELGTRVEYTWWAQRRGFVRNTLNAGVCDVVLGAPVGWDLVLATRPYYRSTYVFAWRRDRALDVRALDDPRLRTLRVGVQLIGDNGINTPPAHALANRGIVTNVRGYTVFGDYAGPHPGARILDALVADDIDVAVVWGPVAGYFADRLAAPLAWAAVAPAAEPPALRFTFAIAAGVRRSDAALRDRIQAALDRRADDVRAILDAYGVPRVEAPTP
ncbi:MAG TPA: quinoprotein dehydrogenase-associated putative ABC transporter substrate-binding protein [Methylomirabilota bacterium]|nr:quinoprotein dehydrogenase-associated putative ABC transporter substrate-binding protein [Methylomirabilota bacterium]